MFTVQIFFILATFLDFSCSVHGVICKGCLELDDLTFDKIVSKFSTVLVKFDIAFPYGNKHEEYAKLARQLSESKEMDIIAAIVGIKNYGQETNNELAERFNVDDRLPAVKLFVNNNVEKWIDFSSGNILFVFFVFTQFHDSIFILNQ